MEKLGVNEERISPLEALHEDLYFVTLDFFSNISKQKKIIDLSPGRILPVIHSNFKRSNGRMKFKLIYKDESSFRSSQKKKDIKTSLNGIVFNGSKVGIDLFIKSLKKKDINLLKDQIRSYYDEKEGTFKITKILEENKPDSKGFR